LLVPFRIIPLTDFKTSCNSTVLYCHR